RPGPQRKGMPVAGVLPGVGGHLVRLADAAGGQDDRGRLEEDQLAGLPVVAECPGYATAIEQQVRDGALGEDAQPRLVRTQLRHVLLLERDDLLLQGPDQFQAGAVTDVRQARVLVPAEVALRDLSVLR